MVDTPERPLYRLEKVCYNCRFYRRKKYNRFSRFGYCTIIKLFKPEIRKLIKEERMLHYEITSIDSSCDWHQYKGGGFAHRPGLTCGSYPTT